MSDSEHQRQDGGCIARFDRLLSDPPAERCAHLRDRDPWFVVAAEPGRRICCDCYESRILAEIAEDADGLLRVGTCDCCSGLVEGDVSVMLTAGRGSVDISLCDGCRRPVARSA